MKYKEEIWSYKIVSFQNEFLKCYIGEVTQINDALVISSTKTKFVAHASL